MNEISVRPKAEPVIEIIDARGRPMKSQMSAGGNRGARFDRDLLTWNPIQRSADADLLPDLKTLNARSTDIVNNYAIASGTTQMQLDYVIGSGLRLSAKPDWRYLGLSAEWAEDFANQAETIFNYLANDPECYSDAEMQMTFAHRVGLAYRQYLIHGETLAAGEWKPGRGSKFATAIRLIDPTRLTNPYGKQNSNKLRAGVELRADGTPWRYHIRQAMDSDLQFGMSFVYNTKAIKRHTPWGRKIVFHHFEKERAGQTRGRSKLAPVLAWAKKLETFQDLSLEAAAINNLYAAVITTDFNYAQAAAAMGATDDEILSNALTDLLSAKQAFQDAAGVKLDGSRVAHLFPGEKLEMTSANHPGPNFKDFESAALGHFAAGYNMPKEMVTRDYSETNYSGARAGMQHAFKFFRARRELVGAPYGTFEYTLILEEAIDRGMIKLPRNAPPFHEAKAAYARCSWIGPGEGHIDPLKENKADELEMDMGTMTYEQACAKRGLDWQEQMQQIAREKSMRKELGITRDDIRGYMTADTPTDSTDEE